jgi:hypothetical protein
MILERNKIISDNNVIEMKRHLTKEEEVSLIFKEKTDIATSFRTTSSASYVY